MKGLYLDQLYYRIWKMADKVADLEANQFDKKPYAERLAICDREGPTFKYDDVTRQQYKDQRRWGHINCMVSMYIEDEQVEQSKELEGEQR